MLRENLFGILAIVAFVMFFGFLYLINWICEKSEIARKIFGYAVWSVIIFFFGWYFLVKGILHWVILGIFLIFLLKLISDYSSKRKRYCRFCHKEGRIIKEEESTIVQGFLYADSDSQRSQSCILSKTTYQCDNCGRTWLLTDQEVGEN